MTLALTKDDLKRLTDLRDEIAVLDRLIERQKEEILELEANRKRWAQTVMMSSPDAACRVVESQVISCSISTDEASAKQVLLRLRDEQSVLQERYDLLLAEVEAWILEQEPWQIRQLLRARYVLGKSVRETADSMNYTESTIMSWESRFWGETGK